MGKVGLMDYLLVEERPGGAAALGSRVPRALTQACLHLVSQSKEYSNRHHEITPRYISMYIHYQI